MLDVGCWMYKEARDISALYEKFDYEMVTK
jgi:hypothetical protein